MVADRDQLLCLFGGSFDPVHQGHLAMINHLLNLHPAVELVILPAAQSPLKHTTTSFCHRLSMLKLATEHLARTHIDDRESNRPGPSYTIDTLREYRHEHPQQRLVWVMGDDGIADLDRWKSWSLFPELVHCLVLMRTGGTIHVPGFHPTQHIDDLFQKDAGLVLTLRNALYACTSTRIRALLATQDPRASSLLPEPVYRFIQDHHLYQGAKNSL